MKWTFGAVILLAALPALADEPAKVVPDDPVLKNLALALQEVSVAAELYVTDMNQRLAGKDARLAQWAVYFKAYIGEPQSLDAAQGMTR